MFRNRIHQRLLRDEHRYLRVVQGQTNSLGRVGGIQGNISSPRLLYPEQADHHVERAFRKKSNTLPWANALFAQPVRELVGFFIQLTVANLLIFELAGHRVRRAFHLLFEELVQAEMTRIIESSFIPLGQLLALALRQ